MTETKIALYNIIYIYFFIIEQVNAGLRNSDRVLLYDVPENRDRTAVERKSWRGSGQMPGELVDQCALHKQLRRTAKIG